MEPLSNECVYAVANEIIRNYLSGRKPTLKEVSESDIVRKYCGHPLTISTVHYIRRVIDELPRLRSSVRRASIDSTLLWSTEPDTELIINLMVTRIYYLSLLRYTTEALSNGTWWGTKIYNILRDLLNPRVAASYVVSEAVRALRSHHDALEYMVSDLTIYKRVSKEYGLKIHFRRKFSMGDRDLIRGFDDLLELYESVYSALLEINKLRNLRKESDPGKLVQNTISILKSYLGPFFSERRFARMAKAAASDALLLFAAHRIALEVDYDVSSYIERGLIDALLVRIRTRRWRNAIVRRGLLRFLNDLRGSGKVEVGPMSEWVKEMPLQIFRVWVSEKNGKYSFTLLLIASTPPNIGSSLFSQDLED